MESDSDDDALDADDEADGAGAALGRPGARALNAVAWGWGLSSANDAVVSAASQLHARRGKSKFAVVNMPGRTGWVAVIGTGHRNVARDARRATEPGGCVDETANVLAALDELVSDAPADQQVRLRAVAAIVAVHFGRRANVLKIEIQDAVRPAALDLGRVPAVGKAATRNHFANLYRRARQGLPVLSRRGRWTRYHLHDSDVFKQLIIECMRRAYTPDQVEALNLHGYSAMCAVPVSAEDEKYRVLRPNIGIVRCYVSTHPAAVPIIEEWRKKNGLKPIVLGPLLAGAAGAAAGAGAGAGVQAAAASALASLAAAADSLDGRNDSLSSLAAAAATVSARCCC